MASGCGLLTCSHHTGFLAQAPGAGPASSSAILKCLGSQLGHRDNCGYHLAPRDEDPLRRGLLAHRHGISLQDDYTAFPAGDVLQPRDTADAVDGYVDRRQRSAQLTSSAATKLYAGLDKVGIAHRPVEAIYKV